MAATKDARQVQFWPVEQPGGHVHEGEGVISDHKYSGHNNSVRVKILKPTKSHQRDFLVY